MGINQNQIRKAIARDLDAVQAVLVTPFQWEVLQFVIKNSPVRSHAVTSRFDLSPQHTAMVMKALYDKGYVRRAWRNSPSGGHEYEFRYKVRD